MKNKDISNLFTRMGTLLQIKGENVFKVRAYFKAADNINSLSEDIAIFRDEKRLGDIPGVGKTLQEKIGEYLDTGKLTAYDKLTKEIPETVLDVISIPSVGPKKAKLFFDELKVKDIDMLEKLAKNGKLLSLEGIKSKTIENVLKGIRIVREGNNRMNLGAATMCAEEILEQLKVLKEVKQISVAGSLRRGRETIGDIDILVASSDAQKVMDVFVSLPEVRSINAHGETKSSVMTNKNIQVDLRVVDSNNFGAALLYFTGSKNFNIKLRQLAIKSKMKVSEYGIFDTSLKKEKCLASKTEKECFKVLGLANIPPELREDIGMETLFDEKKKVKLPALIEQKDIQGEIHVHSTWSDGRHSIKEMAEAARKRGYSYLAISDHSYKLRIARGVSPADLIKKKKEIDSLNKTFKNFRILFGSEVEIDSEGNLDYNDKILSEFDIVIGAIHTGFEQSSKQLTQRLIKACQNKHVNMIAHPTGVHLGKRDPYDFDFKAVCQAAVDNNVCLEINSFPIRLDLNSSNIYFAREMGVKFVINTDSHHINHLNHMRYGVTLARRGWLTKKDVVNTKDVGGLLKSFKKS